jgi:putative ABC transport system substrate-binding protein
MEGQRKPAGVSIRRRRLLSVGVQLAAAGVGAAALSACASLPMPGASKRVARIGYIDSGAPGASSQPTDALLDGLREAGWVEGDNLKIERRYESGMQDRLGDIAAELAALPVEVIVATSTQGSRAAQQRVSNLPIVFTGLQDPVSAGLVTSLARPGSNATGTTLMTPQLHGKRLEILKAIVPDLKTVAVLGNPTSAGLNLPDIEGAAHPLGLDVALFEARATGEFRAVLSQIHDNGAQSLMLLPDALFFNNRPALMEAVAPLALPDMYWAREFAAEGRLVAYGGNRTDAFRRAASYVDKILRGANPSDLPVEQPVQFDFVINLVTAQRLNLTVPQPLLTQATELIRDARP